MESLHHDGNQTCVFMQECQIGINFADEGEAKQFYIAMQKQISDNKGLTLWTLLTNHIK